jgi:hypothetical protein
LSDRTRRLQDAIAWFTSFGNRPHLTAAESERAVPEVDIPHSARPGAPRLAQVCYSPLARELVQSDRAGGSDVQRLSSVGKRDRDLRLALLEDLLR